MADVLELIGESSLTMPTFQNDEGIWIEDAVKTKEVVKTEEVERTGGKAQKAGPCWVKYSIVKERRQGWQWLCL